MSLISIRNLFGPLRSKLQIGALAIAVILVLVIRLGTARSGSGQRVEASKRATQSSDTRDLLKALDRTDQPSSLRGTAGVGDDLLDGLVAEGLDGQLPGDSDRPPAKSEAFEDIRKSLGID